MIISNLIKNRVIKHLFVRFHKLHSTEIKLNINLKVSVKSHHFNKKIRNLKMIKKPRKVRMEIF